MKTAGIDIGSRFVKLAIMENGSLIETGLHPTGADPLGAVSNLIGNRRFDTTAVTGYGRKLAKSGISDLSLTEIKACAIGAYFLHPEADTVIDIGGQDTKIILLNGDGGFTDFVMNDRCAAGTGRFLEMIASLLNYSIEEFGNISTETVSNLRLSSMCAVFAESEIISMISRGIKGPEIGHAVHEAVTEKILISVKYLNKDTVNPMLSGGVAHNRCIVNIIEKRLQKKVFVHKLSQFTAAIGAAIHAAESA